MKENLVKIIAIIFSVIIILNFLLFIFGRIETRLFWIVIIICLITAYKIIPMLKKS